MPEWIFTVESEDRSIKCGHQHYLKPAAQECANNYARRYRGKTFNVLHWSRAPIAEGEMDVDYVVLTSVTL